MPAAWEPWRAALTKAVVAVALAVPSRHPGHPARALPARLPVVRPERPLVQPQARARPARPAAGKPVAGKRPPDLGVPGPAEPEE